MVTIRGGYFKMGSSVNEDGRSNSENPHNILVKDFKYRKKRGHSRGLSPLRE